MEARYLHQIVYCSQRKGRVFRREIMVSPAAAMITRVEQLPPGYEAVLAMMRSLNEEVMRLPFLPTTAPQCECPYCFSRDSFACDCGAVSCMHPDEKHHCCPACGQIHSVARAHTTDVSESGFTSERRLPSPPAVTVLDVSPQPGPKLIGGNAEPFDDEDESKMRRWLAKRKP